MANAYHTGRTQRILEFLARNSNEAFNAREVLNAVEPGGNPDAVGATLSGLAASGRLARVFGAGKRVHYCWPRGAAKPDKRKEPRTPRARAVAVPKPKRTPTARERPPTYARSKPVAEIAKAISTLAAAKRAAPARRVEGHFPAPIASTDPGYSARRAASERIAADIAEFERRGGRVERLGVTKIFHHPDDCAE